MPLVQFKNHSHLRMLSCLRLLRSWISLSIEFRFARCLFLFSTITLFCVLCTTCNINQLSVGTAQMLIIRSKAGPGSNGSSVIGCQRLTLEVMVIGRVHDRQISQDKNCSSRWPQKCGVVIKALLYQLEQALGMLTGDHNSDQSSSCKVLPEFWHLERPRHGSTQKEYPGVGP